MDQVTLTCLLLMLKLMRLINYVNGFHSALQFTCEISETCVSFLDISVSINGDTVTYTVSCKPTGSHRYLLFPSSHPNHTMQSLTTNFCAFAAMTQILRPNLGKREFFCRTWLHMETYFEFQYLLLVTSSLH